MILQAPRRKRPPERFGGGKPFAGDLAGGEIELVAHLQVHPEFGCRGEHSPQQQRGFPGHAAIAVQDRGDAVGRHPIAAASRLALRPCGRKKFPSEDFTGVDDHIGAHRGFSRFSGHR